MIVAKLHRDVAEGSPEILLLVVEPGNLEKLKRGEPIKKRLNDFLPGLPCETELLISYTPDIEWVTKKMGEPDADLGKILAKSLFRRAVTRDGADAERLEKKVPL